VKRVFVDSGAFFALAVADDHSHSAAKNVFTQAAAERWQLITTNMVVIETYALFLSRTRQGRAAAIEFLDRLERAAIRVERARLADEQRAIALVRAHADKTYSLCDALSFVVMERLRITDAIAYDRDFREYGRFALI